MRATTTTITTTTMPLRFGNLAVSLRNKTPSGASASASASTRTTSFTAKRCRSRKSSSAGAPFRRNINIDEWFESVRKPNEFYERFSCGRPRRYFYNVDLRGRLHLEEAHPKNLSSSVKDEKFLDGFFSRIRRATAEDLEFLGDYKRELEQKQKHKHQCDHDDDALSAEDYPFVSRCGTEINFVRPAATPIVFHAMVGGDDHDGDGDRALVYGGSITVPFRSDRLAVSKRSGRLFYRIAGEESGKPTATAKPTTTANATATKPDADTNPTKTGSGESRGLEYGLIASPLAVALSANISPPERRDEQFVYDGGAEIDWLPSRCEPGRWAMPNE